MREAYEKPEVEVVMFNKEDFYMAKMSIDAVKTALSKGSWCLVGA